MGEPFRVMVTVALLNVALLPFVRPNDHRGYTTSYGT
jgi:hypothetical protein